MTTRKKHQHYGWHTKNNKLYYRKRCGRCEKYYDVANEHILYCPSCGQKLRMKAHRRGITQQVWDRRHNAELITTYL